ncbi:MAG: ABC transporter substrate-binding protein [Alphaproteobacteria bacterium]
MEKIHQEFQAEHPCVVFRARCSVAVSRIRNAVELALTSGEAPDVFYSWPSGAGLTAYANAGYYLTDLTPYAEQYGWSDRLPQWAIERNSFQQALYAYPWEQDLEYVYYNTEIFAELGLAATAVVRGRVGLRDTASAAGLILISLGNQDLWPARTCGRT